MKELISYLQKVMQARLKIQQSWLLLTHQDVLLFALMKLAVFLCQLASEASFSMSPEQEPKNSPRLSSPVQNLLRVWDNQSIVFGRCCLTSTKDKAVADTQISRCLAGTNKPEALPRQGISRVCVRRMVLLFLLRICS